VFTDGVRWRLRLLLQPECVLGYRSCLGIIRLVNSRLNAETVHVGTMSNLSDFPKT
jgi:hypothetical protein